MRGTWPALIAFLALGVTACASTPVVFQTAPDNPVCVDSTESSRAEGIDLHSPGELPTGYVAIGGACGASENYGPTTYGPYVVQRWHDSQDSAELFTLFQYRFGTTIRMAIDYGKKISAGPYSLCAQVLDVYGYYDYRATWRDHDTQLSIYYRSHAKPDSSRGWAVPLHFAASVQALHDTPAGPPTECHEN